MIRYLVTLACLIFLCSIYAAPIRSTLAAHWCHSEGKQAPYESEVEYLEGTGTQWIALPLVLTTQDVVHVEYSRLSGTYSAYVFGSRAIGWNVYAFCIRQNRINDKLSSQDIYTYPSWSATGYMSGMDQNRKCTITVDFPNNVFYGWDGNEYEIKNQLNTGGAYVYSLFGICTGDGTFVYQGPYALRIYKFSVIRNGECIMNLVPYKIQNVGCMVDTISCQIFDNSGTGEFIIGPDKR